MTLLIWLPVIWLWQYTLPLGVSVCFKELGSGEFHLFWQKDPMCQGSWSKTLRLLYGREQMSRSAWWCSLGWASRWEEASRACSDQGEPGCWLKKGQSHEILKFHGFIYITHLLMDLLKVPQMQYNQKHLLCEIFFWMMGPVNWVARA